MNQWRVGEEIHGRARPAMDQSCGAEEIRGPAHSTVDQSHEAKGLRGHVQWATLRRQGLARQHLFLTGPLPNEIACRATSAAPHLGHLASGAAPVGVAAPGVPEEASFVVLTAGSWVMGESGGEVGCAVEWERRQMGTGKRKQVRVARVFGGLVSRPECLRSICGVPCAVIGPGRPAAPLVRVPEECQKPILHSDRSSAPGEPI